MSKAALAAIDHFDPEAAAAKAQEAMKDGGIHSETRRVMTRYLATGKMR